MFLVTLVPDEIWQSPKTRPTLLVINPFAHQAGNVTIAITVANEHPSPTVIVQTCHHTEGISLN